MTRKLLAFALVIGSTSFASASACRVVLRRPAPVCPAVTYEPDDCLAQTLGHAGQVVGTEGMLNTMMSGHTYFCVSHEGCYEKKDVAFKGCSFTDISEKGSSKEYLKGVFVH